MVRMAVCTFRYASTTSASVWSSRARTLKRALSRWNCASCRRCSRWKLSKMGREMNALKERGALFQSKVLLDRMAAASAGDNGGKAEAQLSPGMPAPVRNESIVEQDSKLLMRLAVAWSTRNCPLVNCAALPPSPVESDNVGR